MFIASALVLMLTAGSLQAATPTQSSPAQPGPGSLERIKESLATPPAIEVPDEVRLLVPDKQKAPVFRVNVEERTPPPPWEEEPVVPYYVRTQRPAYHHEYLMHVTPEAFRASTLYPGMDVLPAIEGLFETIGGELQERREAQTKRKVRRELERFNIFVEK